MSKKSESLAARIEAAFKNPVKRGDYASAEEAMDRMVKEQLAIRPHGRDARRIAHVDAIAAG